MADGPNGRWDDMVLVGIVTRPHGLRGHVVVRAETDFAESRFERGSVLLAGEGVAVRTPRHLEVRETRWQGGRLVVAFVGIESIEDAEALGRCELRIEPAALQPLPEGRFYHHDLVGCEVVTVAGEPVGTVARIDEFGTATLVVGGGRGEILIPLAAEFCVEIDVAAKRIVVAPIEGLLDANR